MGRGGGAAKGMVWRGVRRSELVERERRFVRLCGSGVSENGCRGNGTYASEDAGGVVRAGRAEHALVLFVRVFGERNEAGLVVRHLARGELGVLEVVVQADTWTTVSYGEGTRKEGRTEDGDDETGRVDRREHVVLEDEEREEDDGDLFEDSCDGAGGSVSASPEIGRAHV